MTVSKEDVHGHVMEEVDRERALVKDFARLFFAIKGKPSHADAVAESITCEEFESYMSQPVARALFSVLGLKIWEPKRFFNVLCSASKDGEVNLDVFVDECMQLR